MEDTSVVVSTKNVEDAEKSIVNLWRLLAHNFGQTFHGPNGRRFEYNFRDRYEGYTSTSYGPSFTVDGGTIKHHNFGNVPDNRLTAEEAEYLAGELIAAAEHLSVGAWRGKEDGSIATLKRLYDAVKN